MGDIIDKSHQDWERLLRIWHEEHRPGQVELNGVAYKVLRPSDDDIKFLRIGDEEGQFEKYYKSSSVRGMTR